MEFDRQHDSDDRSTITVGLQRDPEPARRAELADAAALRAHGPDERELDDPSLYINRELSWLDFNDRVLQLAEDERLPLLERVKFCAIYTTNLDEYYMVRVAGLHDQIDAGVENPGQDGRTPSQTIALIRERVLGLGRRLTDCFEGELRGQLADRDILLVGVRELDDERRAELAELFQRKIFPALTPLA
ncbi:MAG TPA: RNA degradosome polyphosphate kinase, partial [Solirubrobacteraceae bacterium]|nr:RNA degradosome polyphosphate kinase [Solirubrobacteraceae bacterium]